jgi:acetyl-CoA carboxylase biotin carboxyl carrier protein
VANDPKASDAPRPFDSKMVEHLVGLMDKHQLSEINLSEGDRKIRIRKGGFVTATAPIAAAPVQAPSQPAQQAPGATATVTEAAKPKKSYHEIKSPMVGTFYSKPAPDKPDYVKSGSIVKPDTVVCKLEAMKVFSDLTADVSGTIVETCVKNGDPVEYGTVLFRIDV